VFCGAHDHVFLNLTRKFVNNYALALSKFILLPSKTIAHLFQIVNSPLTENKSHFISCKPYIFHETNVGMIVHTSSTTYTNSNAVTFQKRDF